VSGWYVAALIPTEEAFAPAHALQKRVLLATIFLTLLAAGLTWWLLKRQLEPIFATIKTLASMSDTDRSPQPLPITRQDEIGELIGGFNRLLETLGERENALLALKDTLQEQNEELQVNEEELRTQNDYLQTTEEMLRVQINEFETAQKLLRESVEKHRKLENEQRIILNASYVGICLLKDRKIIWANPAHDAIFGYETGSTYNLDTAELYADMESYLDIGKKAYPTIASGDIFSEDVMMRKKNSSLIWCNLVGQAINPENMEEGSIWVILDITERKQAEAERQQLEHQFHQAQKLESLGVLAGGIAHDFNNILTVVMGHCYMAQNNMIPEQEYKEAFQKIEAAGNRAKDLCRQMLSYVGKSPIEQTQVNLWLLMDEVVKMLQAAIKKNVTIELDLKRVLPKIKGDVGQIQQIIMNLIINAAEAIGDNNGTIRVALTRVLLNADQTETDTFGTLIQPGGYICLEVSDNGCGMDEATQKRIFEPFFTTKFTGRGLGMSAIHGIIKSHDGALQLTTTPGVGTTFKAFFPVPVFADNAEIIPITLTHSQKASGSILLVEDEEILLIMGTSLLEAIGFTAMTASNGSEALEIYRERSSEIDVILMDLIMPVMGGIEAYHELRKINPTVPIIICSGYGVESVEHVIKNDTHAGFVHKPYKPEELRDVMMRMIADCIL
jgi:PAS domain S-box-containing protein